jgi:hypothetical protein
MTLNKSFKNQSEIATLNPELWLFWLLGLLRLLLALLGLLRLCKRWLLGLWGLVCHSVSCRETKDNF